MPSNNTENIYATQYGGEGEPIPATKISYDNTTSELTADDVQEAIDEVALETKGNTEHITDLETALAENFIIKSTTETVSVTADGVKDYDTLLGELHTALLAKVSALEDDEKLVVNTLSIGGIGIFKISGKSAGYINTDSSITLFADRTTVGATNVLIQFIKIATTNIFYYYSCTNVPAVTITDMLSTAPTSDNILALDCWVLKQV